MMIPQHSTSSPNRLAGALLGPEKSPGSKGRLPAIDRSISCNLLDNLQAMENPNSSGEDRPFMAHMVRPQGFSLEQLRLTLGHSAIREQCYFIYGTNNILEIIAGFDYLLGQEEIEFGAERLAAIHVTGMMVYLLHHENLASTQLKRTLFMQRCFEYLACTEETYVHHLCSHILGLLEATDSEVMLNLILCFRVASPLSLMARVVANCLLWAMLARLTDLGLDSHRLRPCPALLLVVAMVNPRVYVESYMHALHLVVRLISCLLIVGPLAGNGHLLCQEVGVPPELLELSKEDSAILFRWLTAIVQDLRPQMLSGDLGHLEERLVLLEAICELMQVLHGHLIKCYQATANQTLTEVNGGNQI